MNNNRHWFITARPNPDAKLRLFGFPYAGGGSSVFRDWPSNLPKDVEVCAVQLPGREQRMREQPFSQVEPLVDALMEAIPPLLDRPFAFFGHSLGALVAFVCARRLRQAHGLLPAHLFVSGRIAPQQPNRVNPFYCMPQEVFVEQLRALGGMDSSILDNVELMAMLSPLLRADLQVNETYQYTQELPLDCPISAFRGTQDELMSYDEVAAWREQTAGSFRLRTLPGGHFFINSAQAMLLQVLAHDLEQIITNRNRVLASASLGGLPGLS